MLVQRKKPKPKGTNEPTHLRGAGERYEEIEVSGKGKSGRE